MTDAKLWYCKECSVVQRVDPYKNIPPEICPVCGSEEFAEAGGVSR